MSTAAEGSESGERACAVPCGEIPGPLYAELDDISNKWGHGDLRATTRQAFQLHGVLKGNLKTVIAAIANVGSNTYGGCGDINRNVMAPPVPMVEGAPPAYRRAGAVAAGDDVEVWCSGSAVPGASAPASLARDACATAPGAHGDSTQVAPGRRHGRRGRALLRGRRRVVRAPLGPARPRAPCLLYTSDAADE